MYKGKKKIREIYTGVRNSRNLWDEVWEKGSIDSNGVNADSSTSIRSVNYIEVIPGTAYYIYMNNQAGCGDIHYFDSDKTWISGEWAKGGTTITTPDNCFYIKFATAGTWYGSSYNHDICINVSDPDFNGQYEPYTKSLRRVKKAIRGGHVVHSTPYLVGDETTVETGNSIKLEGLDKLNEFEELSVEGKSVQNPLVPDGYTQLDKIGKDISLTSDGIVSETIGDECAVSFGDIRNESIVWNQYYKTPEANKTVTTSKVGDNYYAQILSGYTVPSNSTGSVYLIMFDLIDPPDTLDISLSYWACMVGGKYNEPKPTRIGNKLYWLVQDCYPYENTDIYIRLYDTRNTSGISYTVSNIQIYNLTLMFGAGNEPSSVDAFRRLFPLDYYPYCSGETMDFVGLDAIVENQVFDPSYRSTFTGDGVTCTNNGDGTFTLNGTCTNADYYQTGISSSVFTKDHVYLKLVKVISGTATNTTRTYAINIGEPGSEASQYGNETIARWTELFGRDAYIYFFSGSVFTNYKISIQFFDLTQMYGPGNEPSSVEAFKSSHPLDYYAYNSGKDFVAAQRRGLVWNQLLNYSTESSTTTINGVTVTYNTDNSLTLNGTSTATGFTKDTTIFLDKTHKYLIPSENQGNSSNSYFQLYLGGEEHVGVALPTNTIFQPVYDESHYLCRYRIGSDAVFTNFTFYPQLYDLTLMFGAGFEPSSVSEFKAMFPLDYYAYNQGEELSLSGGRVKWNQLVTLDSDWTTTDTATVTKSNNTIKFDNSAGHPMVTNLSLPHDHIFYTSCVYNCGSYYVENIETNKVDWKSGGISTAISISERQYKNTNKRIFSEIFKRDSVDYTVFMYLKNTQQSEVLFTLYNLRLIDLTLMFGAGNEPSSTFEFEQWLDDHKSCIIGGRYPYCSGDVIEDEGGKEYNWNQLVQISTTDLTATKSGVTITDNRDGSYTFNGTASAEGYVSIYNNTYLTIKKDHYYYFDSGDTNTNIQLPSSITSAFGTASGNANIVKAIGDEQEVVWIKSISGKTYTNTKVFPIIIDLTQLYGAGNEPSTTAEVKNLITRLDSRICADISWFSYSSGRELNLPVGLICESRNIWDEQWLIGRYNYSTGIYDSSTVALCSKNPIKVLPNTTYQMSIQSGVSGIDLIYYDSEMGYISLGDYTTFTNNQFTTPSNCYYIHLDFYKGYGTTYNNDICISESSSLNGTYTPYSHSSSLLPLGALDITVTHSDGSTSIIGGLKSAGSVCDEYKDGILIQRVGVVDLGTFDYAWVEGAANGVYRVNKPSDIKTPTSSYLMNATSTLYKVTEGVDSSINSIYITGSSIAISLIGKDSSYTSSVKSAMSGILLYYELETPIYTIIPRPENSAWKEGGCSLSSTPSSYLPTLPELLCSYQFRYNLGADQVPAKDSSGNLGLVTMTDKSFTQYNGSDMKEGNTITGPTPEAPWPIEHNSGEVKVNAGYKSPCYSLCVRGNFYDGLSKWNTDSTKVTTTLIDNTVKLVSTTTNRLDFTESSVSMSVYASHIYYTSLQIKADSDISRYLVLGYNVNNWISSNQNITTDWTLIDRIGKPQGTSDTVNGKLQVSITNPQIGDVYHIKNLVVIDLTLLYGSGNEPTTVAQFKADYPEDFYPYYPQPIIDWRTNDTVERYYSKELEDLGCTWRNGINLWDEEWELNSNLVTCKNYITVTAGCIYRFTLPSPGTNMISLTWYNSDYSIVYSETVNNANGLIKTAPNNSKYIKFYITSSYGTTYKNDICISLSNTATNGTYEPYCSEGPGYYLGTKLMSPWSLPDSVLTNGCLPGIGDVHDEIDYARGKYTQRIGKVDLGSLNWKTYIEDGYNYFYSTLNDCAGYNTWVKTHQQPMCGSYNAYYGGWSSRNDKICGYVYIDTTHDIFVRDTDYTDTTLFKSSLGGVYLYYELATPVTYTFQPPIQKTVTQTIYNTSGSDLNITPRLKGDYNEVTVKQLVKNGDFMWGTENWRNGVAASLTSDNRSLTATIISTNQYANFTTQEIETPYILNHKYYMRYDIYLHSNVLRCSIAMDETYETSIAVKKDTWTLIDRIFTKSTIRNNSIAVGSVDSPYEINDYYIVRNIMLFDLTELGLDTKLTTPELCRQYFGTRYIGYGEQTIIPGLDITQL